MKTIHRYSFASRMQFWVYTLLAFVFIGMGLYVGAFAIFGTEIYLLLYALIILVLGLILFFAGQVNSEIIVDNEGLLVQFLVFYLRVPWSDLIEIKQSDRRLIPYAMWTHYSSSAYVVSTCSLTPFHRFYGLFQLSFRPCFVIFSDISNFPDLFATIQNKKPIQTSEKLAV